MTITPRDLDKLTDKEKRQFRARINYELAKHLSAQRRRVLANAQRKEELGVRDGHNSTVDR